MADNFVQSILEKYPKGNKQFEEAALRLKCILDKLEDEFSDADDQELVSICDIGRISW